MSHEHVNLDNQFAIRNIKSASRDFQFFSWIVWSSQNKQIALKKSKSEVKAKQRDELIVRSKESSSVIETESESWCRVNSVILWSDNRIGVIQFWVEISASSLTKHAILR